MRLRSLVMVGGVALAACAPPEVCGPLGPPTPTPTSSPVAHAHNDYEHERPLDDALAAGFQSVEADVWHRDGEIVVSHDSWSSRGTLAALYLEPLDALIAARGSVHGAGAPFFLWLDLKDGTPGLRVGLVEALQARPFLRRFADGEGIAEVQSADGPVTVIVTGDAASKAALLDEVPAPRPFVVDSNVLPPPASGALDDDDVAAAVDLDPRVAAFALSFPTWLGGWDGEGEAPRSVRDRGACIVARAHGEGPIRRVVRLFGGPDTPAAWELSLELGVDQIHTDDLDGLATWLQERRPPAR